MDDADIRGRQLTSSAYVIGNMCTNPITTSANCQIALAALGITYISDDTSIYKPSGCNKYSSTGYFNSNTYGSCTSTYKCLCVTLSTSTYYFITSGYCTSFFAYADSRTLDYLPTATMCTAGAANLGYSSISLRNSNLYPSGCYLDTTTSTVYLNTYMIGGYYGTTLNTNYMEVILL